MNLLTLRRLPKRRICKGFLLFVIFMPFCFLCLSQPATRSKLSIQLLLSTEPGPQNTADGVVAFYDEGFTNAIGDEDSYKFTNPDENIAINCSGTLLSIDGQPSIRGSDTLNLVMWKFRQKSYYLQFSANNFSPKIKAVIKDNYLHRETAVDLSAGTLLPFNITPDSASFAKDRFDVIFKTKRVMLQSSAAKLRSVFKDNLSLLVNYSRAKNNEIKLRMKNMKKGTYTVALYTPGGEMVYARNITHDGSATAKKIDIEKRIPKGNYSLLLNCQDVTIKKDILFQ